MHQGRFQTWQQRQHEFKDFISNYKCVTLCTCQVLFLQCITIASQFKFDMECGKVIWKRRSVFEQKYVVCSTCIISKHWKLKYNRGCPNSHSCQLSKEVDFFSGDLIGLCSFGRGQHIWIVLVDTSSKT